MKQDFVRDVWRRWGNGHSPGAGGRYDPGHFRDAMAGVMRNAGVPEGDICNLFALHEPVSACYSAIALPLFASTVPPAAPVGVSAHLTSVLGATSILAHWYDVSTASDGYVVRVTFDSSVIAEEVVVPAAPSTNFVLPLSGDLDLGTCQRL